jgi:hypothetical protein
MRVKKKSGCEINEFGTKRWYLNGELHREDGPALEFADGEKYWCLNGLYHREDGPAIECVDGTKFWYLNDKHYTEAGYYKKLYELGKISEDDYFLGVL